MTQRRLLLDLQAQIHYASRPAKNRVRAFVYTSIDESVSSSQNMRTQTGYQQTKYNHQNNAEDCAALCRHLPAINHLAYKNGVGIFFRNGMLLGLVVS